MPTTHPGNLSQRLRELRERAGLSARDLSLRAGLNPGMVHDIENSPDTSPRLVNVQRLADVLGVSLTYLATGDTDNAPPRGLSESEAAPWAPPKPDGQRPDLTEAQRRLPDALAPRGRTLSTFALKIDMTAFGLMAGDVLVIDLKTPADPGDIVIATVADLSTGAASTCVRRYLPPYLVANDARADQSPLVVDNARTVILGRVAASFRAPQLTA